MRYVEITKRLKHEFVLRRAKLLGEPFFVLGGKRYGALEQGLTGRRQLEHMRAPIDGRCQTLREATLFQSIEQPYQACSLDTKQRRHVGLGQSTVRSDNREY